MSAEEGIHQGCQKMVLTPRILDETPCRGGFQCQLDDPSKAWKGWKFQLKSKYRILGWYGPMEVMDKRSLVFVGDKFSPTFMELTSAMKRDTYIYPFGKLVTRVPAGHLRRSFHTKFTLLLRLMANSRCGFQKWVLKTWRKLDPKGPNVSGILWFQLT